MKYELVPSNQFKNADMILIELKRLLPLLRTVKRWKQNIEIIC